MLPWKSFVRSATVVTLLTAGTFAAARDVVPFSHVSRSVSPNVVVDEELPAAEDEAPVVDPAAEVDEETTTTTTEPEATGPEATGPEVTGPEATEPDSATDHPALTPEVVDLPDIAKTRTVAPAVLDVDDKSAPRAGSVPDVAKEQPKKQKGDHNCDGHDDNGWHNKSAEWRAGHPGGCPVPGSAAAPVVADEQDARSPKGDHNGDGRCDNGWHTRAPSTCNPDSVRHDRPATAPGQLKKSR